MSSTPQPSTWHQVAVLVRRLAPYAGGQRWLMVGGMVALFAEVAMRLLEPWPLATVIDSLVPFASPGADGVSGGADGWSAGTTVAWCALLLALVVGLRAAASYAMTICFAVVGNRVLTRVRSDLFARLTRQSIDFHDRHRTGDLVTRVTGDVGRLQEVAVTALLPLLGNLVTLIGMVVVVAVLDWALALVALTVLPIFAWYAQRSGNRISGVSRAQRKAEGDLASVAGETFGAMPVVAGYGLDRALQRRFGGGNEKSFAEGVRAKRMSAGLERFTDVLVGLATAGVLWFGANRVLSGALSIGELTVFLTYLKTAFKPLRDMAKYTGRISKALASGERIVDLLDTDNTLRDTSWARPAPPLQGWVSFEKVSAGYPGRAPVLTDFDLTVRPGETVALVGPSGTGKSTLMSLLARLRDPVAGRIRFDGHDLRDLTLDSVRRQVTLLLQESVLFRGTIAENIASAVQEGVSMDEVVAAARLAGADEFIRRLPDGYDTVVGERGRTLSGGQRQRIAIARAAVRRTPIIVLDEPLTGLDGKTSEQVREALARLTAGRTTFLITHDESHAADADRVVRLTRPGVPTADAGTGHGKDRP